MGRSCPGCWNWRGVWITFHDGTGRGKSGGFAKNATAEGTGYGVPRFGYGCEHFRRAGRRGIDRRQIAVYARSYQAALADVARRFRCIVRGRYRLGDAGIGSDGSDSWEHCRCWRGFCGQGVAPPGSQAELAGCTGGFDGRRDRAWRRSRRGYVSITSAYWISPVTLASPSLTYTFTSERTPKFGR